MIYIYTDNVTVYIYMEHVCYIEYIWQPIRSTVMLNLLHCIKTDSLLNINLPKLLLYKITTTDIFMRRETNIC